MPRSFIVAAGLSLSLLLNSCSALEGGSVAGDFPSRTVKIMVPPPWVVAGTSPRVNSST